MRLHAIQHLFICSIFSLLTACANISHPTGGDKDVTPPKLLFVQPADSQLNTRVTKIEMRFDEFVNVTNAASEVRTSPLLQFSPTVEAINKRVVVKIPDSLLNENTTYHITFGNAIGDVHENNPFTGYTYIFSTGNYFDSLRLAGHVYNAATGMNDTSAQILLYEAGKSDSIIVKEKPLYVTKTDGGGNFIFEGLPDKEFKIYALRDVNNNLVYDGENEWIAFYDRAVRPEKDSVTEKIELYLFSESDSVNEAATAVTSAKRGFADRKDHPSATEKTTADEAFTYIVGADTSDIRKRTQDITASLEITFNHPIKTINSNRVNLSFDSSETSVEIPISVTVDSLNPNKLLLQITWEENRVYTLRLLKKFAIDSTDKEAMPSKHIFRTKNEADYAKLHVHLPAKYSGNRFLFVLLKDGNVFRQQAVTDTNIHFFHLQPADYTMRIIIDENKNGIWDHGQLLEKIQPEKVIPHNSTVTLKAGWENIVDFDDTPASRKSRAVPPGKRVAPR